MPNYTIHILPNTYTCTYSVTSKGEAVKCRDIVRIDFEANPTTVGGDGGDDSSAATSVTLHYVIKHKKYRSVSYPASRRARSCVAAYKCCYIIVVK